MDASAKSEEEEFVDSSSDSILSEDWQDLSKSDYAKVIFCDLYHQADSGGVGCKFQITDNVHEDPCDFVGLFRVGYDNLSQCLVSKMLSETECEEDGKLLRCVFSCEELPDLQDGFYQFLYVTRDKEVCGASMPFEIKQAQPKEDSSDDDVIAEKAEDDFLIVRHGLEKKNQMLEALLEKYRSKNLVLSSDMELLLGAKDKICQEKEDVISNLHQEILSLKAELSKKQSTIAENDGEIETLSAQMYNNEQTIVKQEDERIRLQDLFQRSNTERIYFQREVQRLKEIVKQKEASPPVLEPEQRILLEQLEDQKFMIRALEDSKQLAMKEMSDLSESLSKRTKVLNQTRCELASCKGKLKEATSLIDKQNEEVKDLIRVLGEKEDLLTLQAARIQTLEDDAEQLIKRQKEALLTKSKDLPPPGADGVQLEDNNCCFEDSEKLLKYTFAEVEKMSTLIDTLVVKTDFEKRSQHKAFYELKIMFFVILGKMRRPVENRGDKVKKPVSRTLPTCQGETPSENDDSIYENTELDFAELHREQAARATEIQVIDHSVYREPKPKVRYLTQEICEKRCNIIDDMIAKGIPNTKDEDLAFFVALAQRSAKNKPSDLFKDDPTAERDVDARNPVSFMQLNSFRGDMAKLERLFTAIEEQVLKNDDWTQVTEETSLEELYFETKFFLDANKKTFQIDILLEFIEDQSEKLKEICDGFAQKEKSLDIEVDYLKAQLHQISSELQESEVLVSNLKDEIVKKDAVIEFLSGEKVNLLKNEVVLQETVKEHAARITEAAELYKKQFVEIEKLKKKLRNIQRSSSKLPSSKIIEYESSSTAEDMPRSKTPEKVLPPNRPPRKTTSKIAEKAASKIAEKAAAKIAEKVSSPKITDKLAASKTGNKQPPTLKLLLKSFSKNVEKTSSKNSKRVSSSKTFEKPLLKAAQEGAAAIDQEASSSQIAPEFWGFTSASPGIVWPANATKLKSWTEIVKETSEDLPISSGNVGPVSTTTPKSLTEIIKETSGDLSRLDKPISEDLPSDTAKLAPLRSISDSDTGEHVLRNTAVLSCEGDKPCDETQKFDAANSSVAKTATVDDVVEDVSDTASISELAKVDKSYEPGNRDLSRLQKLFTEEWTRIENTPPLTETNHEESFTTFPCFLCNDGLAVTSQSSVVWMDHLETKHQISICPVCGQLFEASFPKKYLIFHVEDHFKSE